MGCVADLHFGLRLVAYPLLWVCAGGSQPLIWLRAHPGDFCLCSQAAGHLSGRPPTRSFRCGPQATDWGTHPLSLAPRQLGAYQGACPPTVSGVGPRPLIGVRTHWGTLGLAPRQRGCLSGLILTWGFRCGPQATDWGTRPLGHFGSGAQAAGRLSGRALTQNFSCGPPVR